MSHYVKLLLDPKCLKPRYDDYIYRDAIEAVNQALSHCYITESEKLILEEIKLQIRFNRFFQYIK